MNGGNAAHNLFAAKYTKFLKQCMSVTYLVLKPFFAVGTKFIYRKHKLDFAEHLILNSFSQGTFIAIGLPEMMS